jgi:hypothetical protein
MIIVALVVGAVVGSAVFPYRRYRFWWKWSHSIFGLSLVVIFAINAAFGIIGVGIAEGAGWHPWHEDWRNGVSFAMLGLAIVRVRLPGVDVDPPESSVHALKMIMRWTFGLLDEVAETTIRTTLAQLEDQELRELVAYILTREVIPDRSLDSQDRAIETDKMAKADRRLREGDRAAWAEMLAWCVLQTRQRLLVIDRLRDAH